MLRVKKDSLTLQGHSHYFEGELFSGAAYALLDGVIQEVYEFKNGKAIGKFCDNYFRGTEVISIIDDSELEGERYEDEEPFLYRQQRFDGLAYTFDGDFCVGGALYDDGCVLKEVSWYKSGKIGFYESYVDGIGEYGTWYDCGGRKSIKLTEQKSFRLEADLTEEEKVSRLSIYGNYFDRTLALKNKIAFPFIEQKLDVNRYDMADGLYLSGDGVDDLLFENLISAKGFQGVCKLHVYNTSLTSKSITGFMGKGNLKEFIIEDDKHDLYGAAKEFKASCPGCYIELNREELEY